MAKSKPERIDPSWPDVGEDEHAVSEFTADKAGALSPFGDVSLPMEDIPYVHPVTRINK
ncbi:hypothetical protein GCM10027174_05120 [Salinifilum aidingensis]